jgi:predicted permease
MWNDLRFALRVMRRSGGVTALAILSLALGIGANTAISSLIYQVAMRSVPAADPERLVVLKSDDYSFGWTRRDNSASAFSKPMYEGLRDRVQAFQGLVARAGFPATLAYRGSAVNARAEVVSGNFFEVLGVRPALGRLISSDDDRPAREPVVVLSHDYWKNHLGSDRRVVNQRVLLNAHPVVVIGVAPAGFRGLLAGSNPDVFAPLSTMSLVSAGWDRDSIVSAYWLNLVARLKPGVTVRRADDEAQTLFRAILQDELPRFSNLSQAAGDRLLKKTLRVEPAAQGLNELRSQWQTPLLVLMAMTGLLLLIACANVANLLLARAAARRREIAVRLAIGASRLHLFRQLLVESVLLSAIGGLLGIPLATFLVQGLLSLLPSDATGGWLGASVDGRLWAYGFLLSLATGVLFGLAPAWASARLALALALKEQSSGLSAGGAQSRMQRLLVGAQICFSLVLLIAAGLFSHSLYNLLNHNVGFVPDHLVTFSVDPSLNGYGSKRSLAYFREMRERLSALPGVAMAVNAEFAPFGGNNWGNGVRVPGSRTASDNFVDVQENSVTPGYFRTLEIPLLAGRDFRASDNESAPKVVVLSRTLARFLFQDENPIGRHLIMGGDQEDAEIVGVVADSQFTGVRDAPSRFLYTPYDQGGDEFTRQAAFFMRSRGAEAAVMSAAESAVKQLDPNIPVQRLVTMNALIRDSVEAERLLAFLVLAFGALAAMLAAVGLYGTISHAVTRRTREFGIRIALGADASRILGLVLSEICWMLGAGIVVGLPATYALARLIESQLFGIRAYDPLVLIGAAILMSFVAVIAGLIPGARAMRIEPVRALKHE